MFREVEVRIDRIAHVVEAIHSTIEEKVLPIIQKALNVHSTYSSAKLDLRSDGPQQSESSGVSLKTRVDLPKLNLEN